MRIHLFVVALFLYSLISCSHEKKVANCGIVSIRLQIFDTITTPHLRPVLTNDSKIWYKDSLAIEEINLIRFIDSAGKQSKEVVLMHYTFIDPHSKSFYYYKTFSDTARIIKKYAGVDSFGIDGGSNFYIKRNIEYIGLPETLSDTVINKIKYKRVKFNTKKGKNNYISIGYFRCDKKGSMFKFDTEYSEKLGCPLVRIDEFPVGRGNPMSAEINFMSDTLSQEELKVFDAWEKNEKKYPIKK